MPAACPECPACLSAVRHAVCWFRQSNPLLLSPRLWPAAPSLNPTAPSPSPAPAVTAASTLPAAQQAHEPVVRLPAPDLPFSLRNWRSDTEIVVGNFGALTLLSSSMWRATRETWRKLRRLWTAASSPSITEFGFGFGFATSSATRLHAHSRLSPTPVVAQTRSANPLTLSDLQLCLPTHPRFKVLCCNRHSPKRTSSCACEHLSFFFRGFLFSLQAPFFCSALLYFDLPFSSFFGVFCFLSFFPPGLFPPLLLQFPQFAV